MLAFDRDGTVSTSNGPIPIEVVKKLKEKHVVYAIGNPELCREANIPYAQGATKNERLRWLKNLLPDADEYIVVDDIRIEEDGWTYYLPSEFVKVMNRYL